MGGSPLCRHQECLVHGTRWNPQKLEQKLFMDEECQRLAIVGLGGVGKTQVALQLAYWVKENQPTFSIFWIPVISFTTFEQAYLEVGKKLQVPMDATEEDPKISVQQCLGSDQEGKWFLIIDNADDSDMMFGSGNDSQSIDQYLPEGENGVMLFTTRSSEVGQSVAWSDVLMLSEMDQSEAIGLLEKSLVRKELARDRTLATELLEKLEWLPLAITQAAADLLSFLSCIEPKAIPRPLLPDFESAETENAIGTLCGYAFLAVREGDQMYDMHSLVHLATKLWIANASRTEEMTMNALKHVLVVFSCFGRDDRLLWQGLLSHALRLLDGSEEHQVEERFDLFYLVGRCLFKDRRFKDCARCLEQTVSWRTATRSETDPALLASERELASAYTAENRVKDAIKLLERVVTVQKEILDGKDHSRLASEHTLAMAYLLNG